MIKIPDKYYVGVHEPRNNEVPLGFATPFGTDSAFNKRKATVDNWCGLDSKTHPGTSAVHENTLIEGFRISESIRRTSSWNGGNVVWRVEDPRGFELEIQSGNFANIIDCTTIINGVIQGRCVWGREGSTNVLLPEASAPYQEALNFTQLSKKSVSKKSLAVGQRVKMKDDRFAYYLGDYYGFAVQYNHTRESQYHWSGTKYDAGFDIKPVFMNKRCVFLDAKHITAFDRTGDFSECRSGIFSYADVKNVAEITDGHIVVDQLAVIAEIGRLIDGYGHIVFPEPPSAVSLSAFKKAEFKIVDSTEKDSVWLMEDPSGVIQLIRNQNFHVTNSRYHSYNRHKLDRDLSVDLLPFDVTKLEVGKVYAETAKFSEKRPGLQADYFAGWTPKTVVAVLDGDIEAPLRVKHYGRQSEMPLSQPHIFEDNS